MGLPAFLRLARAFLRRAFALFTLPPFDFGFLEVVFFAFFIAFFNPPFFKSLGMGLPAFLRLARAFLRRAFALFTLPPFDFGFLEVVFFAFFIAFFKPPFFKSLGMGLPAFLRLARAFLR